MLAFGHHISAPFLQVSDNTQKFNTLTIIQSKNKIDNLKYIRTFNQNQNRDVLLSSSGPFTHNRQNQKWTFYIRDVVNFSWQKGDNTIYYYEEENGNSTLTQYWFLHTFLPIYLTVEQISELIHAGSVEIEGKPVLFLAPSYGGKSTLTDYFIQKGHVMISDDRVALYEKNKTIMLNASYPFHRPYRKMEDLGLPVKKFLEQSKPLHHIYLLNPVDPTDEIAINLLKGIESFSALQYSFDFSLELTKASSFELIAKIAANVPIYKIDLPWDLAQLDNVYKAICTHSTHKEVL